MGETLRITFADGTSALDAVKLSGTEIGQEKIEISLRTENWHQYIEMTQRLCGNNTIPLTTEPANIVLHEPHISGKKHR